MTNCPACATPVPAAGRFCGRCGARLVSAGGPPPIAGPTVTPGRVSAPSSPVRRQRHEVAASTEGGAGAGRHPERRRAAVVVAAAVVLAVAAAAVAEDRRTRPAPAAADATRRTGSFAAVPAVDVAAEVWRAELGTATADGSVSTAALVVDDSVVAVAPGVISSFARADGRVRWRAELDVAAAAEHVVTAGDRLIAAGQRAVAALDVDDGGLHWRTSLPAPAVIAPPPSLRADDELVLLTTPDALAAVDVATGRQLWRRLVQFALPVEASAGSFVGAALWQDLVVATVHDRVNGATDLVVLDRRGQLLDRHHVAKDFDAPAAPVTVVDGVAVVPVGGAVVGVALDSPAGSWRSVLPSDRLQTEYVVVASDGQVVVSNRQTAWIVDAVTGSVGATVDLHALTYDGARLDLAPLALRSTALAAEGSSAETLVLLEPRTGAVTPVPAGGAVPLTSAVPYTAGGREAAGIVTADAAGRVTLRPPAGRDDGWTAAVVANPPCDIDHGDGSVFVAMPQRLVALDAVTGAQQWQLSADAGLVGRPAFAAGRVVAVSGRELISVDARGGADAVTGVIGADAGGTPAVADRGNARQGPDRLVFVPGGDAGDGGTYVHALDFDDGSSRWIARRDEPIDVPLAATPERLVMATRTGVVEALDPRDGDRLWRVDLQEHALSGDRTGVPPTGPPVLAGDDTVLADAAGRVWVIAPDGLPREVTRLDLPLRRRPAVADGVIVTRADDRNVVALSLAGLDELWRADLGTTVTAPPAIAGQAVYVPTADGLTILDLLTGQPRRRIAHARALTSRPLVMPEAVVACDASGDVVGFGATTGR